MILEDNYFSPNRQWGVLRWYCCILAKMSFFSPFSVATFYLHWWESEYFKLKQSHCALPNRISVIWHKKEIRATGGQIAQKSRAKCSTKWTWISWHRCGKLLLAFSSTFLHASQGLNNVEWGCSGVWGMVTSSALFLDSEVHSLLICSQLPC